MIIYFLVMNCVEKIKLLLIELVKVSIEFNVAMY